MSSPHAEMILAHLQTVEQLRASQQADPAQAARVRALKTYQALRFSATYADLLASARYGPAARFFLDELYGPQEFAQRDAQFARVVPALVRLFPHDLVGTVEKLGELHALSETLDDSTARHLTTPLSGPPRIRPQAYVRAWQATGREPARALQIELTLGIGQAMDGYTRKPLMRSSLRLMRSPAKAAGLGDLQRFLEAGFDAFGHMKGAKEFLEPIAERERALVAALFAPDAATRVGAATASATAPAAGAKAPPSTDPLRYLP